MSLTEVLRSTTEVQPQSYIHKSTNNYKQIVLNPWDVKLLRLVYMQRGLLFAKPQSLPRPEDEVILKLLCHTHLTTSFF
ncbi:hypothetical protein MKW92_037291 [Papaver armeniacum]|nr:hypothetical protein MKW92_037291 [Papaver armeniacum]